MKGWKSGTKVLIFLLDKQVYGDLLSKRAVDMAFQALYTLTDIRMILRETAPSHTLDPEQRKAAERLLENLERQVASLKQEMLK
ncbi:MAG TPA: hypothetical protein VMT44_06970 [Methanoregula sp.]|nr:hypothetical protein [Methanoregula sp.]